MKNSTLLKTALISLYAASLLNANEPSTTKKDIAELSCYALICLTTNKDADECKESIAHYYSIKGENSEQTTKARAEFLKMCPEYEQNTALDEQINAITKQDTKLACNADDLNKITESKVIGTKKRFEPLNCNMQKEKWSGYNSDECKEYEDEIIGYRIAKALPPQCEPNEKLKNICDTTYYEKDEWQSQMAREEISEQHYKELHRKEKVQITDPQFTYQNGKWEQFTKYYKLNPINQKCWILEK